MAPDGEAQGKIMKTLGNVLVVEDEEILADNLQAYLARRSECVRIAATTQAALAALREFEPEVVVVDYCLAGMNGLQLLDHIRRQHPSCGAVLITGHPSDTVLREASERGVLDVLFKPFPLGDLEHALARARCPGPPRPAASPWSADEVRETERRSAERRHGGLGAIMRFPLRLADGSWLFADRRHAARRDTGSSGSD